MPKNEPTHNNSAKDTRGFYFLSENTAESIEGYKPGGFHPVHLGDMFPSGNNPRYRILQKLGKGESSTVWLARDMEENRWVALKFIVGRLTGRSQEIAILKSFINQPSGHPGADHVVKLLDSFEIDGPNGTHEVIVTDVFASFSSLQSADFLDKHQRIACYQLLQGLAFIQSHLIINGNLHFGNIGCKIPRINMHTEAELKWILGRPTIIPVIPKDSTMQTNSRPKYIVEPVSILRVEPRLISDDPNFQFVAEIFDFGSAVRLHDKSVDTFPQLRRTIRPPELTFHLLSGGKIKAEWTMASDVWLLACAIHETTFRTSLFYQADSDERLISRMIEYLGPLPDRWKPIWDMKFPRRDDAENVIEDPNYQWERKRLSRNIDMGPVVDLLRTMMRYEPADRPLAVDLLNHTWFTRSQAGTWP